jgi:glycine/D-amino acid oxidase-like deaminating enzyme/nitrite reductase/ring-hydroxylating ferredoxin subunit
MAPAGIVWNSTTRMGTLDERNRSLWVAGTDGRTWPALAGATDVDVAVVGAGITGLTTALLLADSGASVLVVEAGRVSSGVTGYTTAKVTSLHGLTYDRLRSQHGAEKAAAYGEANQAAVELVAATVERLGIGCELTRAAAYTYTEDPAQVAEIEAEVEAATQAGLPATFTTETDLPYPVAGAIRVDDQLHFDPRRYCLGLAEAVDAAGATVAERTRVVDVRQGSPCVLRTEHGEVRAQRVVLATHLPFLDRGGFFARCHPERSYALAARLDGPVPLGMYLSADSPTRSVRPARGGTVVVLGGEGHKVGQDPDTRRRYEALEAWSRERFPVADVDHRWSAQDHVPADGLPFIGPLTPGNDRVFVATGFKKWGMTNGTVAAMILSDRLRGEENRWASTFDPGRFKPRAELRDLVKENANVARRFVGDRLATTTKRRSGDDLAAGEGAVVTVGGKKAAAFRDDDGTLHAVSPVCRHLGCEVTFNTAERTWDCPCHGSRYDVDGRVIEGPATKDLDPVGTDAAEAAPS